MKQNTGLPTISEILGWAVPFLKGSHRLEAELLLAKAIDWPREKLWAYPDQVLSQKEVEDFQGMIHQLSQGEPLQYLLGKQDFMGLDFLVDHNVLIPRSDTELLVEEVLKTIKDREKIRILDLCTGSGAIAISLAKYHPSLEVVAVDISPEALQIAKKNSIIHQVEDRISFLEGDLFQPIDQGDCFDLIVSNPPYITTSEMEGLSLQVKREPELALHGGSDGLDFYHKIISQAPAFLKDKGQLFLEIGYKQGSSVKALCQQRGFRPVIVMKDWSGNDRLVLSNSCTTNCNQV